MQNNNNNNKYFEGGEREVPTLITSLTTNNLSLRIFLSNMIKHTNR